MWGKDRGPRRDRSRLRKVLITCAGPARPSSSDTELWKGVDEAGIHEATWRFEEKGPRVQDETALVAEIDKKRIGMDLPQSIFWATNDLTN